MNLQIIGTNVNFDFPLQATGTNPLKEVLIQPVNDKIQYKVEVSYIVKTTSASQAQQ